MVATVWYLIITTVLTSAQYYVERHFARGTARVLPPTPLQRLRGWLKENPWLKHAPGAFRSRAWASALATSRC